MSEGVNQNRPGERMYQCLTADDLTWREKVCMALIALYDGPGGAFPSRETLAKALRLNQITDVSIITGSLVGKGRTGKDKQTGENPCLQHSISQFDPSGKYYPTRR